MTYDIQATISHLGPTLDAGHCKTAIAYRNRGLIYDDGQLPQQQNELKLGKHEKAQIWATKCDKYDKRT